MVVEVGGGCKPVGDVVIDPAYPRGAPPQRAEEAPWRSDDGPLPDGSADAVWASHVLEHVTDLVAVMNEAHRVLKEGATLTARFPVIGYEAVPVQSWHAWADPTHVRHFWLPFSFLYFCRDGGIDEDYGIAKWAPLGARYDPSPLWGWPADGTSFWAVRSGWEGVVRLVKEAA